MKTITLTDSPAVVSEKRRFFALHDRAALLQEWIDLRHGDVPAHCLELAAIREQQLQISNRLVEFKRLAA